MGAGLAGADLGGGGCWRAGSPAGPVEVSSGNRKTYRLSLRGNRRVNYSIHMAAITQIRNRHSDGRAYYDRNVAEGKTHKEALRCLKRRISNAVYARLQADARQAARTQAKGPGGQPGNGSDSSAASSHPATPALRTSHSRARHHPTARSSHRRATPAAPV